MDLKSKLEELSSESLEKIEEIDEIDAIDQLRVSLLGKKGQLTDLLKSMRDVEASERPVIGKLANTIRDDLTSKIAEKKEALEAKALENKLKAETIDVTLPGRQFKTGQIHVIHQVMENLEDLFLGMGYSIIEGTEIVSDYLNFERVNVPIDHPARDMQDSFYINEHYLLRTQTSAVQPLIIEEHDFKKGPLKVISAGKVYRRDSDDATHSHQFHQIEGIVVDEGITMADLMGTLEVMSKELFGENRDVRFRPSYFPFTEPSVEVDVSCFNCNGSGCHVCKMSGWIEILGAGMIHPNVLEMSQVDSKKYSGFAFGAGPDRMVMLKYGVDDIRHFYLNDQRFLNQFSTKGEK
ncbi:MAG: phenylalanine--tRNA ligase subunit alpha [Atopostipes suicloacalis]|nr:phenylalanine--tRNA ligase subunit alpha [Atopostipes suicloacalis]MDN6730989.1 phenylalanine--tRNA ligase subunit alpha [Atopostipes suicloacalis]